MDGGDATALAALALAAQADRTVSLLVRYVLARRVRDDPAEERPECPDCGHDSPTGIST